MDASVLIMGFTGPIGSGCSFVAEGIANAYPNKFKYIKISDQLYHLLKKDGIEHPSIEQLQNKGNELRRENGGAFLVKSLMDRLLEDDEYKTVDGLILDGIKNSEEVKYLRFFPWFYLFSVHAEKSVRMNRCINKIVTNSDEFEKIDKRDELENESFGQQVKECDYLSDIILLNNETIIEYPTTKKREFLDRIYNRYIIRMEELRENRLSPDNQPTVDEFAMTTAYIVSKMSSCLKRKVGAIIIENAKLGNEIDNRETNSSMPIIISSGYNEVPLGSKPCMFEYEKCYRDYLQEKHALNIKYCPNCGEKIDVRVGCVFCGTEYSEFKKICDNCHKEISADIICPNSDCGIDIFRNFLPGAKKSPGKLLDLCRSLHGEENALLNLAKNGGNSNRDLIMYVTTQPCNLCANKIVASGIKEVVFSEPYFMKESDQILQSAGVQTKRFEGVKSSAFFRLFQ